jgi:hypothetical protein
MRRRIACWNPFCTSVANTAGGTAGGKQRTDSTFVLANVRGLSSLESVGESLRAALNEIADLAPDWLLAMISPDWFDRYVHRFELQRFPKGEQAKETLRRQVGEDSWHLLQAATKEQTPQSVQACPSLARLRASSGTNISSGLTAKCAGLMVPQSRVLCASFRPMRPRRVPVASARPNGWAIIPTCVLRGISKVRKVGHRTQPFGLRFQLCEPFAHLVNHLLQ